MIKQILNFYIKWDFEKLKNFIRKTFNFYLNHINNFNREDNCTNNIQFNGKRIQIKFFIKLLRREMKIDRIAFRRLTVT